MLNPKTNKRELAYIVEVTETKELEGYTNVHYVHVNGWWCVATKSLNKGDKGIYFEIDSLLPEEDKRFLFMEKRKYRVKTLKICKVVSQGLVLPISDFPELKSSKIGDFVTDKLKVKLYEVPEDISYCKGQKKADGWSKAQDRHPFLKSGFIKFLMKFSLSRKILKKIFVKKKDKISWPAWLPKTNSERIQNVPILLEDKTKKWIISEKVDGMSTSAWIDEKDNYFIGSHNVVVYSGSKKESDNIVSGQGYIKNNIWVDMAEKYNLNEILSEIKKENKLKTVAIQGESYGSGVQKRTYSKKHGEQDFVVFHIWFNDIRQSMQRMVEICEKYKLPHVHVYDWEYVLPNTVEELIEDVDSRKSAIDEGMIEGFVLYSQDGFQNVKCVSPNYLIKYHS